MQLKLKVHEEAERDVETALIEAMFDREDLIESTKDLIESTEDLIESISEVEEFEPLTLTCCAYSYYSSW